MEEHRYPPTFALVRTVPRVFLARLDVVFSLSIVVASLMNPRFLFCCCLHACVLSHKRLTQADAKAHPLGNPKISSRPQYLVAGNMFPQYITSRLSPCARPTPIHFLGRGRGEEMELLHRADLEGRGANRLRNSGQLTNHGKHQFVIRTIGRRCCRISVFTNYLFQTI